MNETDPGQGSGHRLESIDKDSAEAEDLTSGVVASAQRTVDFLHEHTAAEVSGHSVHV